MFAVRANTRWTPEEPPIAIKDAVLVHTSVIPPLPPNTMGKMTVLFAVLGHMHQILVHLSAQFVVPVNIRRAPEKPPIAIKVAVLAHTSVIPPPPPNTMNKTIVLIAVRGHMRRILVHLSAQFVVLANIRRAQEESPIAIKVAVLVHTLVIPLLPPNTMNKMIVPFAALVNIRQTTGEPPIVIFAWLAHTSVIPPPPPSTMEKTTVLIASKESSAIRLGAPPSPTANSA